MNASSTYNTTGEYDIIFMKVGSNKVLRLDHTYHINIKMFQNYTINANTINNYDLYFILNGTSNEYDLQSVYNGIYFIGVINQLPQVC